MAKNPIIFLDIDGVLCTARSCVRQGGLMQILDPVGIWMLSSIIEEFNAKLVLSSTWRKFHDQMSMIAILQNSGMPKVPWHQNWKTPEGHGPRGNEIQEWLENNGGPDPIYVIIDDDSDMLPEQMTRFVKTDSYEGISYENYGDIKMSLRKQLRDKV